MLIPEDDLEEQVRPARTVHSRERSTIPAETYAVVLYLVPTQSTL